MPFRKYMELVPAECNEKTRSYIKRKLDELDNSMRNLKIQCGMCKVNRIMFKENRERLVSKLRKRFPNSMVLLKGKEMKENQDCSNVCFTQDSFFYWAFGLEKPNLWGAIDVETKTSYIFYDSLFEGSKVLYYHMYPEQIVNKYKIDKLMSSYDMKLEISNLGRNLFLVLSSMDEKRFSEMSQEGVVKVMANCGSWMCNTVLTPIFKKCRMIKSSTEQYIMAVAAKLNSDGIVFVMRNIKPGLAGYCTGALFDLYITSSARHVSKARPISCLAGNNVFCTDHVQSTFFLKENLESGDLCILDMGVALRNYRTNLIATVPINGIFSDHQAVIYNIVLEIRAAMLKELKPGIAFSHLANTARRTMINQMILNFILEGTTEEIMETGICDAFNPNGIGHLLGIDFYDSEEETDAQKNQEPTMQKRGNIDSLVAKKGMVMALNCELYLNEVIISKWMDTKAGVHLQSRHLPNYLGLAAKVQDVVLITSHSLQLLSNLPRKIDEIEKTMLEKVNIPFRKYRKVFRSTKISVLKWQLSQLPMFNRTTTRDPIYSKNLLKLRYDHELKAKKRLDLDMVLKKIKESREWKPMKCLNEIMEEVYAYPYKILNMLELVMIPLVPQRRRPSFIPFPKVSPLTHAKAKIPKEGYGCPYFNWNEEFESCGRIRVGCLDI